MVQCPLLPARLGEAGGVREPYAVPVPDPAMGPGMSLGERKGFTNP